MRLNKTNNLLAIFFLSCLFISGQSYGQEIEPVKPSETPVYGSDEIAAEFPGGMDSLKHFIKVNMKYPENALKEKIEGKCYLQFVVQKDGSISNVQVKKGVVDCPECNVEAIRIVKSMPRWKPGQFRGENVNSVYSLPISFKL